MRSVSDPAGGKNPGPVVAILLCTCNGERYLAEQLDSIAAQVFDRWTVWASDDGSEDETCAILENYRSAWGGGRLSILSGPRRGVTANFLALACDRNVQAEYFAYADQDDIWEPDKLQRAVAWLQTVPPGLPALYCGRTRLIDDRNEELGYSPLFEKPPSFLNALVQSIAGGNTMVFNEAARELLHAAGPDVDVVVHDWWTYLIVSGCGGTIFYDRRPMVRYRQHGGNQIGASSGWYDRFDRLQAYWSGQFRWWTDRNLAALQRVEHMLVADNARIARQFSLARAGGLLSRLWVLWRLGLYRQTALGNASLLFAALFGRI